MARATTRRQVLVSSAASAVGGLGTIAAARAQADVPSLQRAAAANGLYYGIAVDPGPLRAEPDLRNSVLGECGRLVPETVLKWAALEPERGRLSLAEMDRLASFAVANGKIVHGHTLLWHGSVPAWAQAALREQDDWSLVHRHIASVVPRYGDAIPQWDVVNEPIETGHREDGLRPSIFLQAFGPDYIRRALEDARLFAPHAALTVNEYALDYDIPVERDRRYLFLKLIERLRRAGTPLDGIGIQGHLDLSKGPFDENVFAGFLRELAGMGLFIVISELDVKESDYALPVEQRDARVAEIVGRYLDVALAQPAVRGVITWGLSDRHSWLRVTESDLARFPGAWKQGDGPGLNRGLPLDAALARKPMYDAIEAAFRRAPRRP